MTHSFSTPDSSVITRQTSRVEATPRRRGLAPILLWANATVAFGIMYIPILVLVLYSFNRARSGFRWEGWTLDWYWRLMENTTLLHAVERSLFIAFVTALLATILGVAAALAARSMGPKLARPFGFFVLIPIVAPEIVAAVGMLMFVAQGVQPIMKQFGLTYSSTAGIIVGHLTVCLAYAVVMIRTVLLHCDRSLEDAAKTLGATFWQTFRLVTWPQIAPAVAAAFLLVMTLSLDDFYLSQFLTVGGSGYATLPVYLYSLQARAALTPEMNAIASIIVLMSILTLSLSLGIYYRAMARERVRRSHDFTPQGTVHESTPQQP